MGWLRNRVPISRSRLLSKLWTEILNVELDAVSRQAIFFSLGGDSVACMKLVDEAAALDLPHFSVANIFQYATLADLASCLSDADAAHSEAVELTPIDSFELIGSTSRKRTAACRRSRS